VGRHLSNGAGFVAFITAFGCLIAMRFAARRSAPLTVVLLSAFRVLTRLALGDDAGVLRQREPAGAGRQAGHGTAHRRARGGRLRDPA
jgi:modulator of FtsH protease